MKRFFLLISVAGLLTVPNVYSQELEQAWGYFLQGKYSVSERAVDSVLEKGSSDAGVYYLKALLLMKRASFAEAERFFKKLEDFGGKWAQYGLAGRADTYYLRGDFERARIFYSGFLRRFPASEKVPEVMFKHAECLRREGRWQDSRDVFRNLLARYPDAAVATSARRILEQGEFYFTVQLGSFLDYDNAASLVRKLKAEGYDAYITEREHKGEIYHRVRVGRFNSRWQVEDALRRLISRGYSGVIYP